MQSRLSTVSWAGVLWVQSLLTAGLLDLFLMFRSPMTGTAPAQCSQVGFLCLCLLKWSIKPPNLNPGFVTSLSQKELKPPGDKQPTPNHCNPKPARCDPKGRATALPAAQQQSGRCGFAAEAQEALQTTVNIQKLKAAAGNSL